MCKAEPQRRSLNRLRNSSSARSVDDTAGGRHLHQAQIDQWVAPIALYPDSLLSQVLMASTYPDNVLQAVQWSRG